MYGVSIDDRPDSPVGSPDTRRTIAIHWEWTTEYTRIEMAKALGVQKRTVDRYIREGPTDAVQKQMADVESEVRLIAVAALKQQLKAAGSRSKTVEKPVKIWQDDSGNVRIREKRDDTGEVVERAPVNIDVEMMPDEEARYYARAEVREILDQLADLVGAKEPDQLEVEGSGIIIHTKANDSG
jgi:hypothetical protein